MRLGVGKFLIKKDEVANLIKKLRVPVTISPVSPPHDQEVLVVVNMGPNIGPAEYRARCERVASVLEGERKKGSFEIIKGVVGLLAAVIVFLVVLFA
jgi:hypothetical protein